jgi:predicted transcriptional regulator
MQTLHQMPATTDMEVTSIRLERDLKEKLKELAGGQGYQALIRGVLWDYIDNRQTVRAKNRVSLEQIRASVTATAQRNEFCALTGETIRSQEPMFLGLTTSGDWVPLSTGSFSG